jgi:PEP-CTERM motif
MRHRSFKPLAGAVACLLLASSTRAASLLIPIQLITPPGVPGAAPAVAQNYDSDSDPAGLQPHFDLVANYDSGPISDLLGNPLPRAHGSASVHADLLPRGGTLPGLSITGLGSFNLKAQADQITVTGPFPIPIAPVQTAQLLTYVVPLEFDIPGATDTSVNQVKFVLETHGSLSPGVLGSGGTVTYAATLGLQNLTPLDPNAGHSGTASITDLCTRNGCGSTPVNGFFTSQGFVGLIDAGLASGGSDRIEATVDVVGRHASLQVDPTLDLHLVGGSVDITTTLGFTITPVPEPDGSTLLLAGLGLMVWARRRR